MSFGAEDGADAAITPQSDQASAFAAQVARSRQMLGDAGMAIELGQRRGAHDAGAAAVDDEDRLAGRGREEAPQPRRGLVAIEPV